MITKCVFKSVIQTIFNFRQFSTQLCDAIYSSLRKSSMANDICNMTVGHSKVEFSVVVIGLNSDVSSISNMKHSICTISSYLSVYVKASPRELHEWRDSCTRHKPRIEMVRMCGHWPQCSTLCPIKLTRDQSVTHSVSTLRSLHHNPAYQQQKQQQDCHGLGQL